MKNLNIQAKFVNGYPVIEEKYREKYDVVPHPTKGMHLVLAGEYDHLFRNDGAQYTDVSEEVGLRGTDIGLSASWFDYDEDGVLASVDCGDFLYKPPCHCSLAGRVGADRDSGARLGV